MGHWDAEFGLASCTSQVENTITFESAEGSIVTKNIDEVIAEAMLLEGSLQDMQDSLLVPADAE